MANPYGKGFEHMDPVIPPGFLPQVSLREGDASAPSAPARAGPVIRRANPAAWEQGVTLRFPLQVDGVLLTDIVCRRITGATLTALLMSFTDEPDERMLRREAYGEIAGVHPDVLDALEAGDLEMVMEAIRPFLPAALRDDLDLAALAAAGEATGAA